MNKQQITQEELPHKVTSLICECGYKQVSVYPITARVKDLECGRCLRTGKLKT